MISKAFICKQYMNNKNNSMRVNILHWFKISVLVTNKLLALNYNLTHLPSFYVYTHSRTYEIQYFRLCLKDYFFFK